MRMQGFVWVIMSMALAGLVAGCMSSDEGLKPATKQGAAKSQPAQVQSQGQPTAGSKPPAAQPVLKGTVPAPAMPAPSAVKPSAETNPLAQISIPDEPMEPPRQAEVTMRFWAFLLAVYRLKSGKYPTTAEGLSALVQDASQNAQMWEDRPPAQHLVDPWGHPYVYEYTGDTKEPFSIKSLGPDGVPSGDDMRCQEVDDANAAVMQLEQEGKKK